MLIFIAAKHASHALPVKDLTRLLPRVEKVCLARVKYHQVSENPRDPGGRPASPREGEQCNVQ